MLSISASNQVRFRTRKNETITVLPVTVEFDKFSKYEKSSRMVSQVEWRKVTSSEFGTKEVASPTDLLHAVVALYNNCLPDITVQSLYRTVCAEGTKTLLLLRDTSEILQEWESHHLPSSTSQSREDSLGEINNNPLAQSKANSDKLQTNGSNSPEDGKDVVMSPRSSPETETIKNSANSTPKKILADTQDSQLSTPTKNQNSKDSSNTQDEWRPWTPKVNANYERFRPTDSGPEKIVTPMIIAPRSRVSSSNALSQHPMLSDGTLRGDVDNTQLETPFSDVFTDSGDDSDTGSDMEEEDDHEDFSRGLDAFLRSVVARKKEKRIALERYSLQSTHVGIEHRLVAAATFNKNYRIPGTRVVYLSLMSVRRRLRRCGIGKFLLKKLKSPSQVGPYDALVCRAEPNAMNFFLKNNFTDDIILNSRFRELEIDGYPKGTLMCYLPPFDGHYPPLPGVQEWYNSEAVDAMDEEVEKWRQKSLEAYQTQVTCLTRLQQEVLRLHNLLKKQDSTIQYLKKENQRLQGRLTKVERKSAQALLEVLEKEASDFERFCAIQNQNNETS